jgi:outer membrane protein assembly factor BamA
MLNDEYYYITNFYRQNDYFRERIRQLGLYGIIRYPFNKFWRLDWENLISSTNTIRDWWNGSTWSEEYLPTAFANYFDLKTNESEILYSPQLTLVHDNSIFGSTGPISGWRSALMGNHNFSTSDSYSVYYADFRKYNFFAKRYSIALRASGGAIIGETNQRFDMDYLDGVRGFEYDDDEDLLGKKKVLGSFELRFPFVDNLSFAFPLPIYLSNIRGSAFIDLGAIWTNDLRISEAGVLKDLMAGVGFGPRLNMGFFVLKFDIAWQTDLERFSKPSYYFTLTPDF